MEASTASSVFASYAARCARYAEIHKIEEFDAEGYAEVGIFAGEEEKREREKGAGGRRERNRKRLHGCKF